MPFKKGDLNINRDGRPKKGQSLTDILAWALDQNKTLKNEKTGENREVLVRQALTEKLIAMGLNGDINAIKYIMDRIDGKPIETLNHGLTAISPEVMTMLDSAFSEKPKRGRKPNNVSKPRQ